MSHVLEEALVICSSGTIAEDRFDAFGTPTMVLKKLSSAVYGINVAECLLGPWQRDTMRLFLNFDFLSFAQSDHAGL